MGRVEQGTRLVDGQARSIVQQALAAGRAAWPGVTLSEEDLRRCIRARLSASRTPGECPEALRLSDLYLSCACALGDPAAIHLFEGSVLPQARAALAHSHIPEDLHEEVLQVLRMELFVGEAAKPPLIARYEGRGDLGRWVQVVAVRLGLNMMRRRKTHGEPADAAELATCAASTNMELELLKAQALSKFDDCFREALEALSPRERLLLKLHFMDGADLRRLAAIHHVHRATIARWIQSARQRLLEGTASCLRARLGLNERDVSSLLEFVRSRMDVRVSVFLKDLPRQPSR